ncbi:unnamed protein product [Hydatigera taeniaeformis]|uniref:Protein N-terminal glutamine amidohydrolase n=1 Tax=Hydatigena taeniaeformis TaxID=6205 RepID=A0A0R3WIN7_HYDTA|nr:unnamed protein product [Hydatigera taeniaeformis]
MNFCHNECVYTSHYCEENVYKLVEAMKLRDSSFEVYVVFISNHAKKVPLFFQKSGNPPEGYVVWDYHVIAVGRLNLEYNFWVYDLDTTLEFPCDVTRYWSKAIRPNSMFDQKYESYFFIVSRVVEFWIVNIDYRYFRVVDGSIYLRHFASDRSHMRSSVGWLAPPPTYEAIRTSESSHNLPCYIDFPKPAECFDHCVNNQLKLLPFGTVLTEAAFCSFFAIKD